MEDNIEYFVRIPKIYPEVETNYSITHCYHYEKIDIPLNDGSTITRYLIYSKIGNITLFVGVEAEEEIAKWICDNR